MKSKGLLTLALSVTGAALLFGEAPQLPPAPANAPAPSVQAPLDPGYADLIAKCKTAPPARGGARPAARRAAAARARPSSAGE